MIPRRIGKKKGGGAPWGVKEKGLEMAAIALSKQAEDVVLLHVGALSSLADYYVIGSADSEPQMHAIVEAVEKTLLKKGERPLGIEGLKTALWILMDCNDVIFHLFRKEAREFYNLDRLWSDAPKMILPQGRRPRQIIPVRSREKGG